MAASQSPVVRLFADVAKALRPPARLSYSQWASDNFRLSAESSAQPGRFRPWKPQRGLLDAIGDPTIERVTVLKSVRTGYTKSLVASIGAVAANDPGPVILLMPTDDDARGIVVDEVDPAFRDSPALRGLMRVGRFDGRNTLTQRALLGGGSLKVLSARSPRNLRRHTARYLFCDEVDGMEVTAEGDPIKLGEMRTLSYPDRKIVIGSTPTDDATSIIARIHAESDQRVFEMPCPHCAERFELLWEHIHWTAEAPDDAHAVCPKNGCIIDERDKPAMVEAGEWRATRPEVKGHAGFKFSSLFSLFANASWSKLAAEYEKAERAGPSALQVFHNTVLGEVWSNALETISEDALRKRVEGFGIAYDTAASRWREEIPGDVMYITAGCDVQVDRIEVTFMGWSEDGQRWILGHEVVRGSTKLETTWLDLDALLQTVWKHPLGGEIGIEAACVDAGDGNRTQEVIDFCTPRSGRRIVAIKGRNGPIPVIKASTSKRKRSKGGQLWIVGVDQVKTDIVTAISFEPGKQGCFRFSDALDGEYFRQLTSERRQVKLLKGRPVIEFVRIGGRNAEGLDCTVYAIAARHLCRFDFERRATELTGKTVEKPNIKALSQRLHG